MREPQFPEVSQALLAELDKMFPERCPSPKDSSRKVWMKAGQREVVRFLHRVYAEQNEQKTHVQSDPSQSE